MAEKKGPNSQTSYGNQKQSQSQENEKRANQVPNSKNPKVPGNEAPYQ